MSKAGYKKPRICISGHFEDTRKCTGHNLSQDTSRHSTLRAVWDNYYGARAAW